MSRARIASLVAVVTVASLSFARASSEARAPVLDGCVRETTRTTLVRFSVGGSAERLTGAVLGTGRTGIVLANESDRDLCGWRPFARATAAQGFRVLLFDYHLGDPVQEVTAAAREIRRLGSTRVVLVGASEGAKAAIVAQANDPGLARAVVALAPERFLRRADVLPAARRLRVPALFAVSRNDPYSATDTPALEEVVPSDRKQLLVVPGAAHGVDLVRGPPAATVAAAVYDFLRPLGPIRRPPSLASECGEASAASAPDSSPVAFTAGDGVQLHGVVLGSGTTMVVLAHEHPSSLCGWFPYAADLAHTGYRVLLFDQRPKGDRLDLDVVAAVEQAKALGATRVVAMGASLGGAATLVAAGRDCFAVSGIVSVSGETDLRSYGRGVPPLAPVSYAHRIRAPLLVVGSKDDPLVGEADVNALLGRASSSSKRAVLVAGSTHGWDLLQGAAAQAGIRGAVEELLKSVGPPVATGCG